MKQKAYSPEVQQVLGDRSEIMPIKFDVAELGAKVEDDMLTLHLPVYQPHGPVFNDGEVERMRRHLDLTEDDIDHGLDRFFDYIIGVQVGRILGKRRITGKP